MSYYSRSYIYICIYRDTHRIFTHCTVLLADIFVPVPVSMKQHLVSQLCRNCSYIWIHVAVFMQLYLTLLLNVLLYLKLHMHLNVQPNL